MTDTKITVHQKTFAIEWGDMDALGHVNKWPLLRLLPAGSY